MHTHKGEYAMKRIRIVILTAIVVAALFAAVIPALAEDPWYFFNMSFTADNNGDGLTDKWHLKGDTVWVCGVNHPTLYYDDCIVVIKPSSKGAAVYQQFTCDQDFYCHFVHPSEEYVAWIGQAGIAAKQLDGGRAYFGHRIAYHDGTVAVFYDEVPGGNYDFTNGPYTNFYDGVGWWAEDFNENVKSVTWGVLALPGDGYLYIDWLWPGWII